MIARRRSYRKAISCAFCPTVVELSRSAFQDGDSGEHLWADWLSREFRLVSGKPGRYVFHTLDEGGVSSHKKQSISYKLPVVCRECNNTWMSQLEKFAAGLLRATVTDGASLEVRPADVTRLALWAVKSAIVVDHAHLLAMTRSRPFYSPSERFAVRDRSVVPKNILVNLVAYAGGSKAFVKATYSGCTPRTRDRELKNIDACAVTYTMGKSGFQVVGFRLQTPKQRRSATPVVAPPPGWNDHTVALWPQSSAVVRWPPRRNLESQDDLWRFAHQWVADTPQPPASFRPPAT